MNHHRIQMLMILLGAVLTSSILFPASVSAQEVQFIYGTGFVPETLQDGDRLQAGAWIEADTKTIVVLNHSWSSNDGVCEYWVVIQGKRYQVESQKSNECKELGQGNELAQAMSGKSMVGRIRVFLYDEGKADNAIPTNIDSLNKDLGKLKEKFENEPPSPAELKDLEDRRRIAKQALLEEKVLQGIYTIQQRSNWRYMDAHEGTKDNAVVTRDRQNNNTQRWFLTPLGNSTYTIQQMSNGLYMDAHEGTKDNAVVTRDRQNNNTQRWFLTPLGNSTYTIQQMSNGLYMDAHEDSKDNAVVTRDRQNNNTQRWVIKPL